MTSPLAGKRPAREAGKRPARAAGKRPARAAGKRPARPGSRLERLPVRALALVLGFLLLGFLLAGLAAAQEPSTGSYVGLSLEQALLELRSQGLAVVFSSALVRPDMRVDREPTLGIDRSTADGLRRVLDQILEPHGLQAQEGASGTLVVVAKPGASRTVAEAMPSIVGQLWTRHSREPVPGASIRVVDPVIEVRSGANGRFEIAGLSPGLYSLEVRARGFVPEQVTDVALGVDGARRLSLTLRPAPFVLDEIVVRPSQMSLLQAEPAAPLALSKQEIEALPHLGGDLFRALSLVPGAAANDATAQFSLHGGRRDEVKIELDGQELYDAFHLKDFDNALSIVAPTTLDGANLATGGFTVTHGDRMGGVLDLRTVAPAGQRKSSLSFSLLNATAASAGGFGEDRGSYLVSARRGAIDLATRLLGKEDPAFWDAYGKAELQLDGRNRVSGHYLRAGDTLSFGETLEDSIKRFATDYQSEIAWLTHQWVVGDRLLVETKLSRSEIQRDRRGFEEEESQDFEIVDLRRFDVSQAKQVWSFQSSQRHRLEGGASFRRYDSDFDYFTFVERTLALAPPWTDQRQSPSRFLGRMEGDHLGLWLSDRFSPIEPVTFEVGVRYDEHTATDDQLVSPRFNLAWRLGTRSVARLSWGVFHQSQRPYELQVQDGERRLQRAEQARHWIVGYERLLSRKDRALLGAIRIEAYDRRIRDPRSRSENLFEPLNVFPEAEPDRVLLTPDRGSARGLEVVLRGAAGSRGDWWLNYSLSESKERYGAEVRKRQLDQPHAVNFNLAYRLTEKWSLNLALRYHTGWPTTPSSLTVLPSAEGAMEDDEVEPRYALLLGPVNSLRLPSYHRLDLRASRQWTLPRGQLTFFVDIQNAYNRKNSAGFDHEVDVETGILSVSTEEWTGIFPSAGISWEF